MENATDALLMAGSIFLLIIALTVSISSFSSLKAQVEDMVSTEERLAYTTAENGDYLSYLRSNSGSGVYSETRTVGVEAIISAIRRIKKEGYTIYIKDAQIYGNSELEVYFRDKGILPADYQVESDTNDTIKLNASGVLNKCIDDPRLGEQFYNLVSNGQKYKEYIGIYQNNTEVSSANKLTYKIITFEKIQG